MFVANSIASKMKQVDFIQSKPFTPINKTSQRQQKNLFSNFAQQPASAQKTSSLKKQKQLTQFGKSIKSIKDFKSKKNVLINQKNQEFDLNPSPNTNENNKENQDKINQQILDKNIQKYQEVEYQKDEVQDQENFYHYQYINLNLNNHSEGLNKFKHLSLDHQKFIQQLEALIFAQIKIMQLKQLKDNYILEHLTDDLDIQIEELQNQIKTKQLTPKELLKVRMHIQAINKMLVFIHGKSQFRLVQSHYYIGQAYRLNGCYQQAIDHYTIGLKKNAKLTEVKQTKVYHSFILTSLSECYFQLQMYFDSLEILLRAFQIQSCYINSDLKINNIKTIKLISQCYLKMKNYRQANQYIDKICQIIEKLKGANSKEFVEMRYQRAIINGEQGAYLTAIQELKAIIQLVRENTSFEAIDKEAMILKYSKKMADYYQEFKDFYSQIATLKQMVQIIENRQKITQNKSFKSFLIKSIIAIKKKIVVILVKTSDHQASLSQLQRVVELQQQKYGRNSLSVKKTLKMLGLIHLHLGNQKHAQQYLKKCYKISNQIKNKNRTQRKSIQNIQKNNSFAVRKYSNYSKGMKIIGQIYKQSGNKLKI